MEQLLEFTPSQIWTSVIIALTVGIAIWEGIKKIFNVLNKYHKKKSEQEDIQTLLKQCVENDIKMTDSIDKLNKTMTTMIAANKVQMRHSIVRIAESACKEKVISAVELASLEELYDVYKSDLYKGNSYVHTLMKQVRILDIDYSNGHPEDYTHSENDW